VGHIAGIILAAGASSRMGPANKLLLRFREHTVVEETLVQMAKSHVDSILVVTGYEKDRIESVISGRYSERIGSVFNDNYQLGRAESIKCAVRHLSDDTGAALFMVADKPSVPFTLIDRAIERYRKDRPAILCIETPHGRGHPIIFSKSMFAELLRLEGDCVGNELLEKYKDQVVTLEDTDRQVDIDCEADYQMLMKAEAARPRTWGEDGGHE
jgi:molybdenum cofactor cytidylyltransferase